MDLFLLWWNDFLVLPFLRGLNRICCVHTWGEYTPRSPWYPLGPCCYPTSPYTHCSRVTKPAAAALSPCCMHAHIIPPALPIFPPPENHSQQLQSRICSCVSRTPYMPLYLQRGFTLFKGKISLNFFFCPIGSFFPVYIHSPDPYHIWPWGKSFHWLWKILFYREMFWPNCTIFVR